MTIKCLAFDLDGTLLTDQKEIDPRTKEIHTKSDGAGNPYRHCQWKR